MEQELLGRCCGCGVESSGSGACLHCGAVSEVEGYRTEQVLSQTPHSRMYLARSPDGELVALKELLFSLVPSVEEVDAFERESRVLRQLNHSQIPRYLASFQVGMGPATRFYLAQEYVAGEPLSVRLERGGVMQEAEARDVLRQVLGVLVYLQDQVPPILHRDIKPQNLIRTENGVIHLVDFGAARDLSRGTTHRATLVGTFGYMPIEQLGGTASPASDLFALGATVLHLLTGRHPSELVTEGYTLHIGGHLPVSPRFQRYLERLVARDRSERFGTAREALAALDALETAGPLAEGAAAAGRGAQSVSVHVIVPKPKRVHIDETSEVFVVWWRWFAPKYVIWGMFSLTLLGQVSLVPVPIVSKWVLLLPILVLAYSCLAGLVNTTRLQLTREALEVRHGPLPWRRNHRLNFDEVTCLYCTRERRRMWPWPWFDESASYSLHAMVGDRNVTLVKSLEERDHALWLKRALEEQIGLPERPIEGDLAK